MERAIYKWASAFFALILIASVVNAGIAHAAAPQDELVTKAEATFNAFRADPKMEWFAKNLSKSKAVIIAPSIVKAGFILGGSGGHALLMTRDKQTGKWVGPVFYTLATVSAGFQAGIEVSEAVMLVMTEKALDRMLRTSFKIGGDVSIAAGPVGAGAESSITADVVSFTRSKGIYGGINANGSVVDVADQWNESYFKKKASPADILVRQTVHNAHSDRLLNAISAAAK